MINMRKQERNVLIAGGFGFLMVLGLFAFKKILKIEEYEDQDYNDIVTKNDSKNDQSDDQHGVEYYSMR